jgi:hypothetical protein
LSVPDKFRASASNRGIRDNLAFEGITFTPDFSTLYVATENALLQDGPMATFDERSPSRIIEFDFAARTARAEYVDDVSPIPFRPTRPGGYADNGIVEILATGWRLLVLERSCVDGRRHAAASPIERDWQPTWRLYARSQDTRRPRRRCSSISSLGIRIDNVEGMAWGPWLPSGNVASSSPDNNFGVAGHAVSRIEVRER